MSSSQQPTKANPFKQSKNRIPLTTAMVLQGASTAMVANNTSPLRKHPFVATVQNPSTTKPIADILTFARKHESRKSPNPFLLVPTTEGSFAATIITPLEDVLPTLPPKNKRPSLQRKSMMVLVLGLLLSSGLLAGAMNITVREYTPVASPQKTKKATASKNKRAPVDLFQHGQETHQTHAQSVAFVAMPASQLAEPPASALDEALSFETDVKTAPETSQLKQQASVVVEAPSKGVHVVDLFEDTAPVPVLSLPEQKKRETLAQALETVPALPTAELVSKTVKRPWWKPDFKSRFNFHRPLMHLAVSSHFGHRWGRMHRGVDFKAPYGTAIYATQAGSVVYAGWEHGYGQLVIVDHGDGVRTKYAHCSRLNVAVGDWVEKGDRIAKVGSTGHSTGPHLHFEVVVNGQTKNPLAYL